MTRESVIRKLRQLIAEKGTAKAAAQFLGVSSQYLSDVLKGRRDPGDKILSSMGLQSRVVYEVKIHPDPPQEGAVA